VKRGRGKKRPPNARIKKKSRKSKWKQRLIQRVEACAVWISVALGIPASVVQLYAWIAPEPAVTIEDRRVTIIEEAVIISGPPSCGSDTIKK
jgi:hypothetical protein